MSRSSQIRSAYEIYYSETKALYIKVLHIMAKFNFRFHLSDLVHEASSWAILAMGHEALAKLQTPVPILYSLHESDWVALQESIAAMYKAYEIAEQERLGDPTYRVPDPPTIGQVQDVYKSFLPKIVAMAKNTRFDYRGKMSLDEITQLATKMTTFFTEDDELQAMYNQELKAARDEAKKIRSRGGDPDLAHLLRRRIRSSVNWHWQKYRNKLVSEITNRGKATQL